jgi:5-methylthioadenosine/S-adenosylhomocysteine deaminase
MKFAIYGQKQNYPTPLNLGGAELALELATIRGAEVLGMEDEIGSIELGKAADLCLLNRNYPSINPLVSLLSNLVYSCGEEAVQDVIIGGEVVLENRRCRMVDELEVVRRVNSAAIDTLNAAGIEFGRGKPSWLFIS